MNISAKFGMISAAVFASICLGVAITGFLSIGEIADPVEASDARGYAWFWMFLAGVAVALGVVSWRIDWTQRDDENT